MSKTNNRKYLLIHNKYLGLHSQRLLVIHKKYLGLHNQIIVKENPHRKLEGK